MGRGSGRLARRAAGGAPVLTVVKVGGGIGDDALPGLCAALGELGRRHALLVVPGGAHFADAVRDADRRFGLSAEASHRMAILGMEQYGWLLSELIPETRVLLPAGLPLDELPASWQVTSDSIAAWVADRVGAERLVLLEGGRRPVPRGRRRVPADALGAGAVRDLGDRRARPGTDHRAARHRHDDGHTDRRRPLATLKKWPTSSCGTSASRSWPTPSSGSIRSWAGATCSRTGAPGRTSSPASSPASSGTRARST